MCGVHLIESPEDLEVELAAFRRAPPVGDDRTRVAVPPPHLPPEELKQVVPARLFGRDPRLEIKPDSAGSPPRIRPLYVGVT